MAQSRNAQAAQTLKHSKNLVEECRKFYDHLLAWGYPARAIDATFRKVSWNQRSKLLGPKVTSKADNFFLSRVYYHNGGFRVWRIQKTWKRLRVSPVRLISFKTRLS